MDGPPDEGPPRWLECLLDPPSDKAMIVLDHNWKSGDHCLVAWWWVSRPWEDSNVHRWLSRTNTKTIDAENDFLVGERPSVSNHPLEHWHQPRDEPEQEEEENDHSIAFEAIVIPGYRIISHLIFERMERTLNLANAAGAAKDDEGPIESEWIITIWFGTGWHSTSEEEALSTDNSSTQMRWCGVHSKAPFALWNLILGGNGERGPGPLGASSSSFLLLFFFPLLLYQRKQICLMMSSSDPRPHKMYQNSSFSRQTLVV